MLSPSAAQSAARAHGTEGSSLSAETGVCQQGAGVLAFPEGIRARFGIGRDRDPWRLV